MNSSNFDTQFNNLLPYFKDNNPSYNEPIDNNFTPDFIKTLDPTCL